jgi:polar amino acid transport system substrate-binding protein
MCRNLLILTALLFSFQTLATETWKITSLDWKPYTGESLPEGGIGIAILRAALKAEGIDLVVEFYPWTRAIHKARDPGYAGLYPKWDEEIPAGFLKSPALFKSPVGFVEPRSRPLVWTKLEDLKGKTIGVVQDYGNTLEFMALVKSGVIKTEVVVSDIFNVRKVAAGRIDGAFIDLNNLSYLLKNDAKDVAQKVQANSKVIDTKNLFFAINVKFKNKNAFSILQRGLSKIHPDKIINDYKKKYMN